MAWKAVAPKTGSPGSKTVGKNTYHWCPHHGFWTVHKPSECTLATNEPAALNVPANRPMTFAEAATAVIENDDDGYETAQE
jgi:hypothetical protein